MQPCSPISHGKWGTVLWQSPRSSQCPQGGGRHKRGATSKTGTRKELAWKLTQIRKFKRSLHDHNGWTSSGRRCGACLSKHTKQGTYVDPPEIPLHPSAQPRLCCESTINHCWSTGTRVPGQINTNSSTALPSFFRLPLVRWNKSFICNLSQICNKTPSLNPTWPKLGLFWTLPDSAERFASAPTLFQVTIGIRSAARLLGLAIRMVKVFPVATLARSVFLICDHIILAAGEENKVMRVPNNQVPRTQRLAFLC